MTTVISQKTFFKMNVSYQNFIQHSTCKTKLWYRKKIEFLTYSDMNKLH